MQASYLVLVGLLSYFLMVELSPGQPSVIEIIVWAWSLTLAIEMIREVKNRVLLWFDASYQRRQPYKQLPFTVFDHTNRMFWRTKSSHIYETCIESCAYHFV
jgi:hypothetical protein